MEHDPACGSTWCYCFPGIYAAIFTSDPTTSDQLAYAHLIIRETQGPAGWTMIVHFASRHQLTHHRDEIHFYRDSRHWPRTWPRGHILYQMSRDGSAQCAQLCLYPQQTAPLPPCPNTNLIIFVNRGLCIFPGNCTYQHGPRWLHLQTAIRPPSTAWSTCSIYHSSQCPPVRPVKWKMLLAAVT